ncbi:TPA: hypothetical protein DDY56_04305 [Candidatus Uhrbacteria bacterium]|nr:MAG: hypothetical protein A2317_02235 [Candidatus Uhrbacteria bacterium RIFOXYB2_FULL_41_10]HAL49951.1 hypothetical protein [Candidatus Uhrbacteria bacterium]HAN06262.1 hypothetical protein [Candidatus Uhrbacteria bacterium]HAP65963.1 hypothetical protein [Candidatus Uhrbacteria bacterium]HBA51770.1 hypothetical protein [Candidatus Uhrbacteria bacterium]
MCVVSESRGISTIESANVYHGKYLVLGGVLNPIEGQTPDVLHVKELIDRIKIIQKSAKLYSPFHQMFTEKQQ